MFKSLSSPRQRLADQVYNQLLEAIHAGDILPADRIVQEKLAEQFEISRTPIREALLRLEQERIIEASSKGGFRIRVMSEKETREIYEARAAIEGQAAWLLATRISHSDSDESTRLLLESLKEKIQREESLTSKSARDYFKANMAIHRAFVEACDNRYLLEMFDSIWNRGTSFQLFASIDDIDLADSLGGHSELVEILAQGDATLALQTMSEHIEEGLLLQQRSLQSQD